MIASLLACEDIPVEPPVEQATESGPLMNGLFSFRYDVEEVDSGEAMVMTTLYRIVSMDTTTDQIYTLQPHPLFTVLARTGHADAIWVDQGAGLSGIPRGFCSEMSRR